MFSSLHNFISSSLYTAKASESMILQSRDYLVVYDLVKKFSTNCDFTLLCFKCEIFTCIAA